MVRVGASPAPAVLRGRRDPAIEHIHDPEHDREKMARILGSDSNFPRQL
jgi:hypothetical protein